MPSLVNRLRDIADEIETETSFPTPTTTNTTTFWTKACRAVMYGGKVDSVSLSSLLYYIADMMEE